MCLMKNGQFESVCVVCVCARASMRVCVCVHAFVCVCVCAHARVCETVCKCSE